MTRAHRLRGRTLTMALVALGVTAVLAACTAAPDRDGEGSGDPFWGPPTTADLRQAPDGSSGFTAATTAAQMGGCDLFPPDHYMNAVNVDLLDVDPRSSTWMRSLGDGTDASLRFPTSKIWNGARAGTPMNVVDSGTSGFTDVIMNFSYAPKAFPGPYPIPSSPKVQGYPSAQWDKHLLIVDSADCRAYELIQYDPFLAKLTGIHSALNGITYSLDSTEMPTMTTNSPNTPMIGQYVRVDEVRAGQVPHVLAFCSNRISTSHQWPARSSDGVVAGPDAMPMGTWIRLKADVDRAAFAPEARAVVEALRERGAVLTDTCSHSFSLLAENSGDWNDAAMQQLTGLDTADFEVVDTTAMRVDTTSYRIR